MRSVSPADFTYKTLHSEEIDGSASIDVMPRCECGAKHWARCQCIREGVRYTGAGIDHTGCPCLEFLQAVVTAHPGCDYITVRYPTHLQEKVDAIVNGVGHADS